MRLIFCVVLYVYSAIVCADNDGRRYVTIKSQKINLRVGPGKDYPIVWTICMSGMPAIVLAEFDNWYKVQLHDKTEGWLHRGMVSKKNTAIVQVDSTILYSSNSTKYPIAKLEKNVAVHVLKKENNWVKIEVNKMKGWMNIKYLWGVE